MDIESGQRILKKITRTLWLITSLLLLTLGSASASVQDEPEWQIQIVDLKDDSSNDVGKFSSIALDPQGVPHISYYDLGYADLKYASREMVDGEFTGNWIVETVDEQGDVGQYSSLAIDSNGIAHISYYDNSTYSLKYARQLTGTGWISGTVDSKFYRYSSLGLDAADQPHISYYEAYPNYDLKYASYDGQQWITTTVDTAGYVGQYSSLALDADGFPHISYFYFDLEQKLKYSYQDSGGWVNRDPEMNPGATPTGVSSIALDRQGKPHIAFIQQIESSSLTFQLIYANWDGTKWQSDILDTWGDNGGQVSLALDRTDRPHIAYYDGDQGDLDLKYAHLDSDGWQIEIIDLDGDVGSYPSIALSRFGLPHISYRDSTEGAYDLKYATLPFVLRQVYLPLSLQNWVTYFTWPHELEDNDATWQANGALISGQEYIGYHNDENDYFSLYTHNEGTLTIDLDTDHLEQDDSGYYVVQLMLYSGSDLRVDRIFEPPYHIDYAVTPGWYYVRVFTAPGYLDGSKEYRLTVTTP